MSEWPQIARRSSAFCRCSEQRIPRVTYMDAFYSAIPFPLQSSICLTVKQPKSPSRCKQYIEEHHSQHLHLELTKEPLCAGLMSGLEMI